MTPAGARGQDGQVVSLFYMAKDREAAGNLSLDRVSRTGHITGLCAKKAQKKGVVGG